MESDIKSGATFTMLGMLPCSLLIRTNKKPWIKLWVDFARPKP